ncbi:MAG TPA: hypothetical protein VGT41_04815 [Candidatus Babeliales bacterium]|nr:hypothetical protein [Candidatus Babeliales bacterium]
MNRLQQTGRLSAWLLFFVPLMACAANEAGAALMQEECKVEMDGAYFSQKMGELGGLSRDLRLSLHQWSASAAEIKQEEGNVLPGISRVISPVKTVISYVDSVSDRQEALRIFLQQLRRDIQDSPASSHVFGLQLEKEIHDLQTWVGYGEETIEKLDTVLSPLQKAGCSDYGVGELRPKIVAYYHAVRSHILDFQKQHAHMCISTPNEQAEQSEFDITKLGESLTDHARNAGKCIGDFEELRWLTMHLNTARNYEPSKAQSAQQSWQAKLKTCWTSLKSAESALGKVHKLLLRSQEKRSNHLKEMCLTSLQNYQELRVYARRCDQSARTLERKQKLLGELKKRAQK